MDYCTPLAFAEESPKNETEEETAEEAEEQK